MLDGVLWVLATGGGRGLLERFGPWQTAYDRFAEWRNAGVLASAAAARRWPSR